MPNQSKRCNVVFPVIFGPWFRSFLSGFPTKVRCAVRRLSGQLCLGGEYQEQNSAVSYSSWLVLKSEIEIQITSNKKPVNWILYNHSKRQQKPSLSNSSCPFFFHQTLDAGRGTKHQLQTLWHWPVPRCFWHFDYPFSTGFCGFQWEPVDVQVLIFVPQFVSPKTFNVTKYSNWRWLVSKPTWIDFTSFWIAVIQLTPKTSVSVSKVEFHFQPWNSTGGHIDPFREECHGRWFTELTGNVMENIQRKRYLGVPKLASFCWAWTLLSGQSGCKKCPAGTSTYGDPGAAVLPEKELKLKDVHDVILIDWFVGFADHRCWFAWKWIPFGRVWFECQGFECIFFVDFLWKVAWGKVMPLVLLQAPLP